MRGSDPDAAVYWMMRMIEAGEDPLFIARRMVIFAAEDIGNADPQALQVAVAAKDAVHFVGFPEGRIPLAQAVTYLASAPKSNASYKAMLAAAKDVRRTWRAPGPVALAQRADRFDAKSRLRQRLQICPQLRRPYRRAGTLAKGTAGRKYYTPVGVGLGKADQRTPIREEREENTKNKIQNRFQDGSDPILILSWNCNYF